MRIILSISFFLISSALLAQKPVEFRGVQRSGYYAETGLLKKWPETGPELILKIEGVGKGFSQPVCANNKIFVTGIKQDTIDILSAYNMAGKMIWDVAYGRSWTRSYIDSRSTPTYENGKVYVVSGTGQINCVEEESGKIIWQVDASKKFKGEIHKHGDAEAPLIVGDVVLYVTGGESNTLVALNKEDGSLVWKTVSLGGAKSYASPSLITHNGKPIILVQTYNNLIGIDPASGNILWSYNLFQYHLHSQGKGAQTNIPLYHNNEIFVTSGYNHPALMFSLSEDGTSIQLKWRNDTLDTHHGGVVLVDGNIYGSNWENNSRGKWASINWETGKTNWENSWENKGAVITADNMLYLVEEKRGNVALAEPTTDSLKIVSSFKIEYGAGPHWSHPAIYDGKLFVRHGDVLMVYNIKDE